MASRLTFIHLPVWIHSCIYMYKTFSRGIIIAFIPMLWCVLQDVVDSSSQLVRGLVKMLFSSRVPLVRYDAFLSNYNMYWYIYMREHFLKHTYHRHQRETGGFQLQLLEPSCVQSVEWLSSSQRLSCSPRASQKRGLLRLVVYAR